MQILKPIVHETIWGGSRLTPFSGTDCKKIGHLYSAIDTEEFRNQIVFGEDSGKNLHEWFLENRQRYGLENYAELPVLMGLIDASDDLSIQVHPDDVMAEKLEQKPFGKNESFYTLEAPTCGKMYNGCKASSKEALKQKITDGRALEALDMMPCRAGDYVYIVGGTLHAATAGSLHFEIEENCEKTYRFYDFGRVDSHGKKRALQLEKALMCLDVSKKSVARSYQGDAPIEERMYLTRHIAGMRSFTNHGDMFSFAVMLRGHKAFHDFDVWPGTAILLTPGEMLDAEGADWIIATPKKCAHDPK